jgi:hypothetical protein
MESESRDGGNDAVDSAVIDAIGDAGAMTGEHGDES